VRPRFQADADLHADIVTGVLRREPTIDFQTARERLSGAMTDMEALALSAAEGRILVSHDVNTLPKHFRRFVADGRRAAAGVFLIPQSPPLSRAIDELVLIWSASDADEWHNLLGLAAPLISGGR
jgi:hypothetical protein